jgi:hypothetical protein
MMKIKNINGSASTPLAVGFKNLGSSIDRFVNIVNGEVVWCPNDSITNSIRVYQKKGLIIVTNDSKPEGLNFFEAYRESDIASRLSAPVVLVDEPKEAQEEVVSESLQETIENSILEVIEEAIEEERQDKMAEVQERLENYKIGTKKEWTEKQIDYLKENFRKVAMRVIVEHLGFAENTIRTKAKEIGILQ